LVVIEIRALLVIGARPQFIKSAPIIHEIIQNHKGILLFVVHSGQHYDPEMSNIFFQELRIPKPSLNLRTGSGSHASQTARIMSRLEHAIFEIKPDIVMVPGDTNTTLASALTAAKLDIPVAHVEAGLRSGDLHMPEEINRRLTDHCSSFAFAPTKTAVANLNSEGLHSRVYFTGDTMVDAMDMVFPHVQRKENRMLREFDLQARQYVLVTLHRPSNVDDSTRLHGIFAALGRLGKRIRVVFPVHPRTMNMLRRTRKTRHRISGIKFVRPQGYVETLSLLKNAACVITDSGGIQKESFLLHVPCVTIRTTTEWPETLRGHANRLVNDPERIPGEAFRVAMEERLRDRIRQLKNPFGDGRASVRIARILENYAQTRSGQATAR
jgi:UDP-N-acetylglucosamine 2-epimerase